MMMPFPTPVAGVRDSIADADARTCAARRANAEDAAVWRWFAGLLDDRRIRWRFLYSDWIVHVDRRRVATESNFYDAIRAAKEHAERLGVGSL